MEDTTSQFERDAPEHRNPYLALIFGLLGGSGATYVGRDALWWVGINVAFSLSYSIIGILTIIPHMIFVGWCYTEALHINQGKRRVRALDTVDWVLIVFPIVIGLIDILWILGSPLWTFISSRI